MTGDYIKQLQLKKQIEQKAKEAAKSREAAEEKLAKAVNEIESMMQDGIIVLSDVDVIRLVHSRPAAESSHANG